MFKLFQSKEGKESQEEKLILRAEKLILDQLSNTFNYNTLSFQEYPAAEYVREVINSQIDKVEIKEKINSLLESELLDKIVSKHIKENLKLILTENIIEGIVDKINKVQIKAKR